MPSFFSYLVFSTPSNIKMNKVSSSDRIVQLRSWIAELGSEPELYPLRKSLLRELYSLQNFSQKVIVTG